MSDVAVDRHGNEVTIMAVLQMDAVPELWCAGKTPAGIPCRAKLGVKALHSEFMSPHFHGRHRDGCDRGSERSEDQPGDRGRTVRQGPRSVVWRLQLGSDAPSTGPDGRHRPDDTVPGRSTRRGSVDGGLPSTRGIDPHALSVFLDAAIAGMLPDEVELPPAPPAPVGEVVVPARAARSRHYAGRTAMFWGRIDAARPTRHNGMMLRLENAADGVAVLLTDWQLAQLHIEPSKLVGRHVIAYGTYIQPEGLPYVKTGSLKHLAFAPAVRLRRTPAA